MDHYKTLGVRRNASRDDIKRAYHKLALKYHPDKNTSKNAGDIFRSVNEAYETLIDEHKRSIYDRYELPSKSNHQETYSSRSRPSHKPTSRYDDSFFTGSASEELMSQKRFQEKIDQIRRFNTELLEEANAKLRKSSENHNKSAKTSSSRSTQSKWFTGEIMPNADDDEYEKIVLSRLKDLASRS